MAISWLLAGYQLAISYIIGYLLADHGPTTGGLWGYPFAGYWLAISELSAGYGMAMDLLWDG